MQYINLKLNMLAHGIIFLFAFCASMVLIWRRSVNMLFKVVSAVVAAAVLYLGTQRDTYLPFLGMAALPSGLLMESVPKDANTAVHVSSIDAEDGAKVIYWAAAPGGVYQTPQLAYGDYTNSGVAVVKDGAAVVKFRCPGKYHVRGKLLPQHVHYRVCKGGLAGEVETIDVSCKE